MSDFSGTATGSPSSIIKQNPDSYTYANNKGGLTTVDKANIGLAAVGAATNLGSSIYNAIETNKTSKANTEIVKEQIAYQKALNEAQMQREDTSYSRAIADLQANGINKLLAADNGGIATGSYQGTSFSDVYKPNSISDIAEVLNQGISLMQGMSQVSQTAAQTRLINEEILNKESLRNLQDSQSFLNQLLNAKTDEDRKKIIQERINLELEYKRDKHDLDISERYDIRLNDMLDSKFNTLKASLYEAINDGKVWERAINPIIEVLKELSKSDKLNYSEETAKKPPKDSDYMSSKYPKDANGNYLNY